MPKPNQIDRLRDDFTCTAAELLAAPKDAITEAGLRLNINVGILYLESWLRGNGAAAIHNLMEDAATAEISRTQIWQWIKNSSLLDDGRTVSYDLFKQLLPSELEKIRTYAGETAFENGKFEQATTLFDQLVKSETFIEFLTLPAYALI